MNEVRRAMLSGYLEATRRSSEDDEFRQRLIDSPREALAEHGWEVPQGTEVEVAFGDPPDPARQRGADELVAEWERGIADGRLRLELPNAAPAGLETTELSEDDLESAVGGLWKQPPAA